MSVSFVSWVSQILGHLPVVSQADRLMSLLVQLLWRIVGICVIFLLPVLGACGRVTKESEVTGVYRLDKGERSIVLEVRPDHSFVERVLGPPGGQQDERRGTWSWSPGRLDAISLWIPRDFAPAGVVEADRWATPRQFKYTKPGMWSLPVERYFWTTQLVVFPDDGISFEMQKHP